MKITRDLNIKDYEKKIENEFNENLTHFQREITKLRTGRAHPAMVEDIKVSCYGALMPIKELASISVQDSSLLVVQPWDKTLIDNILKALATSDLNLNPQTDGEVVRIKIPPMSLSRREELIKSLNQKAEACKIAIRNNRKELQNQIREAEKNKSISEDFSKSLHDILQKSTDKFIKLSDDLASQKEVEIKNL